MAEEVTAVKHQSLRSEDLNTHLGLVQIDENGFVSNLDDLGCSPEQLVAEVASLRDASGDYNPKEDKKLEREQRKEVREAKANPDKRKDVSDEDLKRIISELLGDEDDPAPTNTEGFIQMEPLNDHLRENGYNTITGTRRKQIQESMRQETPPKDPEKLQTARTSARSATSLTDKVAGEGKATAATADDAAKEGVEFKKEEPATGSVKSTAGTGGVGT